MPESRGRTRAQPGAHPRLVDGDQPQRGREPESSPGIRPPTPGRPPPAAGSGRAPAPASSAAPRGLRSVRWRRGWPVDRATGPPGVPVQSHVRADRDRLADRREQRPVGVAVRVGVGPGQVDAVPAANARSQAARASPTSGEAGGSRCSCRARGPRSAARPRRTAAAAAGSRPDRAGDQHRPVPGGPVLADPADGRARTRSRRSGMVRVEPVHPLGHLRAGVPPVHGAQELPPVTPLGRARRGTRRRSGRPRRPAPAGELRSRGHRYVSTTLEDSACPRCRRPRRPRPAVDRRRCEAGPAAWSGAGGCLVVLADGLRDRRAVHPRR